MRYRSGALPTGAIDSIDFRTIKRMRNGNGFMGFRRASSLMSNTFYNSTFRLISFSSIFNSFIRCDSTALIDRLPCEKQHTKTNKKKTMSEINTCRRVECRILSIFIFSVANSLPSIHEYRLHRRRHSHIHSSTIHTNTVRVLTHMFSACTLYYA